MEEKLGTRCKGEMGLSFKKNAYEKASTKGIIYKIEWVSNLEPTCCVGLRSLSFEKSLVSPNEQQPP